MEVPRGLEGSAEGFFNSGVARVPGAVEALAGPLEARLCTPSALLIIMSRNQSVRNEIENLVYLNVQTRPNLASLVR